MTSSRHFVAKSLPPPLRQPTHTKWCLPTAVLYVLRYQGIDDVPLEDVVDWCGARDTGCSIDEAINRLRGDETPIEIEVEDLSSADDPELWERVNDDVAPDLVIALIVPELPGLLWRPTGDTVLSADPDHAVVVTNVTETYVEYMDPLYGEARRMDRRAFRMSRRLAGSRAFVVRA
jgi:hypothetical protein